MLDAVKEVLKKDIKDISFEKTATTEPVDTKPLANVPAYDYSLISFLRNECEQIKYIYDQVISFTVEEEYDKATGRLDEFNKIIRQHYQKADVELYSYLKRYIHIKYPKREKAFTELSLEMKNISIDIFFTTTQSPNLPLNEANHSAFIREFRGLGKLLQERFTREEEVLFPMYESTNKTTSIS